MFYSIITICFSCILILSQWFLKPFLDITILVFSISLFLSSHCSALIPCLSKSRVFSRLFHCLPKKLSMKKIGAVKYEDDNQDLSLLDLPDSILECILERLPSEGLYRMAGVSRSLREKCISDYLWEKHMNQKWGALIGPAANRKWACYVASQKETAINENKKGNGCFHFFKNIWTLLEARSMVDDDNSHQLQGSLPVDSVMALYLSLQTGKFWFPAQVFNREYGHVGFTLSCYDAEVCYHSQTNTFRARFPARTGKMTLEENIEWNRLRKPSIDTPIGLLHASRCLSDLKPSDHVEIQWRTRKEFPYGWWYAVVGHLDPCNGDAAYCQCHMNDTVVVEFTQYSPGSRWRQVLIERKEHREVGNQIDGFYGGIRKLDHEEEISRWKSLWPANTLDSLE